ncbi:MAG TPA: acyl-CoA synthetase [Kangiella sp.]
MKYSFESIVHYNQDIGEWQWQLPSYFNICEACVDQHAKTDKADQAALIVEDETLGTSQVTYDQLAQKTSQFANLLQSLHIESDNRILIRLPNSLEYPVAFFGAIKYSAIAVPTSALLAASEVAYLANDSQASVLVTHKSMWQELEGELKNTAIKTVFLTGAGELPQSDEFQLVDFDDALNRNSAEFTPVTTAVNDPAYLVYTSGTTGYPKGVLHAQRALLGRLPASRYWFDFQEGVTERIMHSGKFNWTYVLGSALMDPLLHGHTVIAYEGHNDAHTWPKLIQKHQCSIFIGVPTIYRQIIQKTEYSGKDLSSLKHCMSAGEHLSDEMQSLWEERFNAPIYEAIGMSEISYYISQHKQAKVVPGAAGFVQPGHQVALLDVEQDELKPVPNGEEGMICIRADDPGLFLSYWNLPEETVKAVRDGWFFTGDYAKRDAQDYVWFLGRKDDIINTFGFRVSPHEIERVIKAHPDVADCVALGEEVDKDKTLIVVCVIPEQGKQVTEQQILDYGQEQLAKYKAPKKVYLVVDYPRTKNGKVLRKKLLQNLDQYLLSNH